ncbi:MAG TPA: hypothetical protein VIH86_10005 [Puia sp.]|jgi:hypothetical protein
MPKISDNSGLFILEKTLSETTMSDDPEQLQQHQEVFANDIMEKPFSTETTLLKVKALLGK